MSALRVYVEKNIFSKELAYIMALYKNFVCITFCKHINKDKFPNNYLIIIKNVLNRF